MLESARVKILKDLKELLTKCLSPQHYPEKSLWG